MANLLHTEKSYDCWIVKKASGITKSAKTKKILKKVDTRLKQGFWYELVWNKVYLINK